MTKRWPRRESKMRGSKVDIRPIVASDKDQWRKLWTGYLEFYESSVD
jgi:hypothetical protein